MKTLSVCRFLRLGELPRLGIRLMLVGIAICGFLTSITHAQNRGTPRYKTEVDTVLYAAPKSPVRLTYGGRGYLSFPNYDVYLFRAPRTLDEGTTEAGNPLSGVASAGAVNPTATVIMKNQRGMRWDGGSFFLHPAYPYKMVTRFRYTRNIVGEPRETQWPEQTTKFQERDQVAVRFSGPAQLPLREFRRLTNADAPRYHAFPIPQVHTDPMEMPTRPMEESTHYSSTFHDSHADARTQDNEPELKPRRTGTRPSIDHGFAVTVKKWNVKTLKSDRLH